jgi:molecular chaperone HscB
MRLWRVVSRVNLQSNDFELFGVPKQFAQDRAALDARWKELQREAHPDKFAAQGDAAQRVAMQWSVRINEAYQRLRDPLKRAAYLCELAGSPVNAHSNTAMPAAFLMEQMQWREDLDDADSDEALNALRETVDATQHRLLGECAQRIDHLRDFAAAVQSVRALMFIEKFGHDLDLAFDKLET